MTEQLMNLDLKAAYEQSIAFAKSHSDISVEMLKQLSSIVLKNTGTTYKTALGEFSVSEWRFTIVECYGRYRRAFLYELLKVPN